MWPGAALAAATSPGRSRKGELGRTISPMLASDTVVTGSNSVSGS